MDRRPDLDWLRVIAFGLLILYHAGFAWTGWEWHLNSDETLPWLAEAMRFTNRWRIPLIYMVAGGTIVLALGQRGVGAFAIDRACRLLLPLVFGVPRSRAAAGLHRAALEGAVHQLVPAMAAGRPMLTATTSPGITSGSSATCCC